MKKRLSCIIIIALLVICAGALAQSAPPMRINYQGVVRDTAGNPLDGSVTMTFRFWDAATSGNLLWEEIYDSSTYPPQASVSGGLFTVALGDSTHRSGGSETLFPTVLANHSDVYLGVSVGADNEMTPRIKVVSAPYSLNSGFLEGRSASYFAPATHTHSSGDAGTLDGFDSDYFLNTSSTPQSKTGALEITSSATAVSGIGATAGGYFKDSDNTGYSYVGNLNYGIRGYGSYMGGQFENTNGLSNVGLAATDLAVGGSAPMAGGWFKDSDGSGYAYVGIGDTGIEAYGNTTGGYFKDSDNTGYAQVGTLNYGIRGYGSYVGGAFENTNGLSHVELAATGLAVGGSAPTAGGWFADNDSSGYAYVGYGDYGVEAHGNTAGGYFVDRDNSGYAYLAISEYGIRGFGNNAGGRFEDSNSSGIGEVGSGDYGIYASGNEAGGYFLDYNSSGYSIAAYDTYKIYGTGSVSFVQNHPVEKDRVIVYASPEGDEVATYTRGSARLANGKARIILGDTFQWVTNPDIGLTAHLTPREECGGLYVESVSTTELVVKELDGGKSNAAFDYIVYGLRIGFEETSIVQEKRAESFIPSFREHRERYAKYPSLKRFSALDRFTAMEQSVRGESGASIDLSRAEALKASIHEYDPSSDPPITEFAGHDHLTKGKSSETGGSPSVPGKPAGAMDSSDTVTTAPVDTLKASVGSQETVTPLVAARDNSCLDSIGAIEPGDVLVMDQLVQGAVRVCENPGDHLVVGIAAEKSVGCSDIHGGEPGAEKVAVITSGLFKCKADAGYGPIAIGDILIASPTPGHAMKAQSPQVGTIVGKAMESLNSGTGTIKVVVMVR